MEYMNFISNLIFIHSESVPDDVCSRRLLFYFTQSSLEMQIVALHSLGSTLS